MAWSEAKKNWETPHKFPIGSLVEIFFNDPYSTKYDGCRLYVVYHHRDCDNSPLYCLAFDRTDVPLLDATDRLANPQWLTCIGESSLTLVAQPRMPD